MAVLLSSWEALAQAPVHIEPHRFELWTREQGLPQITVTAIAQDSKGFLWVGTDEGLARFDGVQFTPFHRGNTPELGSNAVRALRLDRRGNLWIGTRRGLNLYRDGRFTHYGTADGLIGDHVRSLFEDTDGALWIGTGKGLSRFLDSTFISLSRQDGLVDDSVRAIAQDRDGALWIGTDVGLSRLKDGAFRSYSIADGLPHGQVRALFCDRRGRLWIGTAGGLVRYRDDRFEPLSEELRRSIVSVFHQDGEGRLWLGSNGGLSRFENDTLVQYSDFEANRNRSRVRALWEDHEGNLWIGTGTLGLASLRHQHVSMLDRDDGLVDNLVWSILEAVDGTVWKGSNRGLTRRTAAGDVSTYTSADGLPGEDVRALWQSILGDLWIGTDSGGLARWRDGGLHIEQTEQEDGLGIAALLEDPDGVLWIATNHGLQRRRGGDLKILTTADGLPHDRVWTLHQGPRGDLWIGTAAGLARYRDGELSSPAASELADSVIKTLHHDAQGILWIGTAQDGLLRLREQDESYRLTRYTTRDGLYDSVIHHILEDDLGWLWLSSNRGVFRIRKTELEDFADGSIETLRSIAYTERAGMSSRECNGMGHPAGMVAKDGRLWFPTVQGVAIFNPARLTTSTAPIPVHIDRLTVDQRRLDALPSKVEGKTRRVKLAPGAREIELHYRALSFLDADRLRYRYRLEGFDADWIAAGTVRSAKYTNLQPGEYRFRVVAADAGGLWTEAGDTLDLQLRPAFHQTWIFYLACALAAAVLVRGLHRLRVRRLLHQNRMKIVEAKNREIEQLTYNVCHDLKSPLVTIQGFVNLLEDDLADHDQERITQDLDLIRGATTQMADLLNGLLAYSQSGQVTLESEPLDLSILAREAAGVVAGQIVERGVEVKIREDLPWVIGDRRHLLRLFQNLIDNAVKFMGAQESPRIVIDAELDDGRVVCRVGDNGSGIDFDDQQRIFELFGRLKADVPGSGIGLALVHRIVTAHGGRIWVESAGRGRGSTFFFTLPRYQGAPSAGEAA